MSIPGNTINSFLGTYNGYNIEKVIDSVTGSTTFYIQTRKSTEEGFNQPANIAGPYSSSNIASTKIDALILRRAHGSTN